MLSHANKSFEYTGYKGFQPHGHRLAPTLKTGEGLEVRFSDVKFSDVGHGVQYNEGPPIDEHATIKTVSAESTSHVTKQDFRPPGKRGCQAATAAAAVARTKPFLHSTLHKESYRDINQEIEGFAAASVEAYRCAFLAAARDVQATSISLCGSSGGSSSSSSSSSSDGGSEGPMASPTIDVNQIPGLLVAVHSKPPRWLADRLRKACEGDRSGQVRWDTFVAALARVLSTASKDGSLLVRTAMPEWVLISRKAHPTIQHGKRITSCYQHDVGGAAPAQRQLTFKRGMRGTTQDLFEGTTKDTFHVPGYGGFIPASKVNARAMQHGDMQDARAYSANLRLFHKHNMAGYTGHQGHAACNDRGELLCGTHPATTSGAAALGLLL
ncbi:hypothetical protein JKP88DRAFT_291989 [Tribonema minus]|uniref:Uncharacterized protein n=1 Tax=Tribonema minus TaxID=303371 RepID=A0A835ZLH4_9STRA|nr:hypothetical protein JKP88DRAFT_291989 [Tribonema minus]